MGPNRELKFALERYWKGKTDVEALLSVARSIEEQAWDLQVKAGLDFVAIGDHYLYDGVLTWTEYLGIHPKRFSNVDPGTTRMFAMARGVPDATALGMKKWITSNYHYMVPEFDDESRVEPNFGDYLECLRRGIKKLGKSRASPVVLGPVSMIHFINFDDETKRNEVFEQLLQVYAKLLSQISNLEVGEIQIHEPVLVFDDNDLLPLFKRAYPSILPQNGSSVNVVSFMDDIGEDNYRWLVSVPEISTVSMDFTRGKTLSLVEQYGFPSDKKLGVGIVDSRTVWKIQPSNVLPLLSKLAQLCPTIQIHPSGSLQYLPWDLSSESELLQHPAGPVLSFAEQKLDEVRDIASTLRGMSGLDHYQTAWESFLDKVKAAESVTERLKSLSEADFCRNEIYEIRRSKQLKGIPILPTTTIGSFPQTKEIRRLRSKLKAGEISENEYNAAIDQQIAYAIGVQEAIGLDVLVHGEAERTDMVEYFAHQMEGMLFTSRGWVQSFGSRCVRPPIIWSDILRRGPMTVREFKVAQDLTSKPVKGMLTGPVTILNWSFPRVDTSRKEQAMQIALALRDEIKDLEANGCQVIQVDEPALREAMPLRKREKQEYLNWAVDAFRLATAVAKSETQIHTHMCYCEFGDCMDAINRLDTDVNSIENARSSNSTINSFKEYGYKKELGPGTYDIHSPVVPSIEFISSKISSFLECFPPEKLFVNPDCGLKTRTWSETIDALYNMVAATKAIRASLPTK